jgi:hypothetical protein
MARPRRSRRPAGPDPDSDAGTGRGPARMTGGEPLPKSLAAYWLGVLSYAIWMWHEVALDDPDEVPMMGPSLPIYVDQFREALVSLIDEIPANVDDALRGRLDRFIPMEVVAEEHWREFCRIAARAVPESSPSRRWYDLGAAVGRCWLLDWKEEPATDAVEDEPRPLPGFVDIVRQAEQMPGEVVERIPILGALIAVAAHEDLDDDVALLVKFVRHGRREGLFEVSLDDWALSVHLLFAIDDAIQEGAWSVSSEPTPRAPGPAPGDDPAREGAVGKQAGRGVLERKASGGGRAELPAQAAHARSLGGHTTDPGQASDRPVCPWDDVIVARNKFIYEKCCKKVIYKQIRDQVKARPEWEAVRSDSHVRQIAKRYAEVFGLPRPPARHRSRRR